jgi:hypothetical protein
MYYEELIKEIIGKDKSLIKSINWGDDEEVEELRKTALKFNIKDDCKIITKSLSGMLGLWVFKVTKDGVIAEQQNMIDKLCDAAAFFCALAVTLDKKIQNLKR